jgi:hypothetical protein
MTDVDKDALTNVIYDRLIVARISGDFPKLMRLADDITDAILQMLEAEEVPKPRGLGVRRAAAKIAVLASKRTGRPVDPRVAKLAQVAPRDPVRAEWLRTLSRPWPAERGKRVTEDDTE